MTKDEIIEIAKVVGFSNSEIDTCQLMFQHFANLVAQREREACAKYVESLMIGDKPLTTVMGALGEAIRARRQA
jgi:hypothetical protein